MHKIKQILQKFKSVFLKSYQYILSGLFILLVTASSFITIGNTTSNTNNKPNSCNTIVIHINGELVDYKTTTADTLESVAPSIVSDIESAENDKNIKAVILSVESGGGSPIGGQQIANALKRISKPTVALIGNQGESASYWASTGANRIFASNLSTVGDIGIIQEAYDQTKKDQQDGYSYHILTSDKYKSVGDVHKPMTQSDKNYLMKSIMQQHEIFVDEIATNRNIDRAVVAKLADGSNMLGQDALTAGLVDSIGDMSDIKAYLKDKIGADVVTCEY